MSTVIEPREPDVGAPVSFTLTRRAGGGAPTLVATESPASGRARWLESLAIFVVFGAAYGVLGYWLVVKQKVVTFEDLQRLANAYLAWHGHPAKLAAVGFSLPPLQGVVLLPFTLIASMGTSLVALPVCSAIFGGLTMVAFNRLLDRCDMPLFLRYPVLILTGLIPTLVFYSAGGGSEMISLYLLATAISALIAWFRTVDTRYLISSGLAFGLASLADYANLVWMLLAAMMVATVLARHGADDAEVEGSLITYVAPALCAIAMWCLINWLIIKSPFGWIDQNAFTPVNAGHSVTHSAPLTKALADSLRLALNAAPLSLVIAPALIIVAVVQRNELAGWLAAFTILAIFRPGAEAVIHANIADLQMQLSPPQILMAIAGGAWLYESFPDARSIIGGGLILGLVATVIVVWHGINAYPYQNMESAFHQAVEHTSAAPPTTGLGGVSVGVAEEKQMASYITANVHGDGKILTDNSQTYGVILESAKPSLFVDRLESGGAGKWLTQVRNPPRSVRYFLIAYNDASDAVRAAYPTAASGGQAGLTVVYKNRRYALIAITPGTTQKTASAPQKKVPVPDQIVSPDDVR